MKQTYFEPSATQLPTGSFPSSSAVAVSLRGSRLKVSNAIRDDSGYYVCTSQNEFGSDSVTVQLIVFEQPDPPVDVKLTDVTSRTMTVTWNIDFDGNSPLTATVIEVSGDTDASGIIYIVR